MMYADGSNRVTLVEFPGWYPDWSPNGKHVIFHAHESSTIWSIYAVDAEGSNLQRLMSGAQDASPEWSPDGTNVRRLMDNQFEDWWPAWSPDGQKIAFQSG
jgi:Tol biopolymer transport system component